MDGFFWTIMAFVIGYLLGRNSVTEPQARGERVAPGDLSGAAKLEMEQAIRRGNKIEAIRIVREDTGAGLKESKAFVDAFADKRLSRRPGDPIE